MLIDDIHYCSLSYGPFPHSDIATIRQTFNLADTSIGNSIACLLLTRTSGDVDLASRSMSVYIDAVLAVYPDVAVELIILYYLGDHQYHSTGSPDLTYAAQRDAAMHQIPNQIIFLKRDIRRPRLV